MIDIREMLNISYFDNKELSLKEHCDIYSNIKKDVISILNKYDIKYVLAETEVIKDLSKENQSLKKQLEENKLNHKQLKDLDKIEKSFIEIKNQQKEFIEYLENEIKERKIQIVGYHPTTQLLIEQIIETEKMVLSKYKEIIGGKDE